MLKYFFNILIILFAVLPSLKAQSSPIVVEYNRIHAIVPPDIVSQGTNKIFKTYSVITIDFDYSLIKTYYGINRYPAESIYRIESISGLKPSKGEGEYFVFTCSASNYATVIFEVKKEMKWIKRYVPHNHITHIFYYVE